MIRAIFGAIFGLILRIIQRLAVWTVSVGVAFVPAVSGAQIWPSTDFFNMMTEINDHKFFREVFFVTIILSILGVTNLIDNIFRRKTPENELFKAVAWSTFAFFILLIVYGTYAFTILKANESLGDRALYLNSLMVLVAMIAGAVTEVLIAFAE